MLAILAWLTGGPHESLCARNGHSRRWPCGILQSSLSAKLPTVKVIVAGLGLATDLPLVDKKLLVNVWGGIRSTAGWLDFPQPFMGATVAEPRSEWPRDVGSFVARWTPQEEGVVY